MHGVTQCRNCGKRLPREQFEGRDHVLRFPPLLRDECGRIVLILWRLCEQCLRELGPNSASMQSTSMRARVTNQTAPPSC